jgi:hypothetical protein
MRELEMPLVVGTGPGKSALDVSEECRFGEVGGNRDAIDRDERASSSRAAEVNGARR